MLNALFLSLFLIIISTTPRIDGQLGPEPVRECFGCDDCYGLEYYPIVECGDDEIYCVKEVVGHFTERRFCAEYCFDTRFVHNKTYCCFNEFAIAQIPCNSEQKLTVHFHSFVYSCYIIIIIITFLSSIL